MKPVIGVTKSSQLTGKTQNLAIRICLFFSGAKAVNLSTENPCYEKNIDGLVLSGGTDLYPGMYNNQEIKQNYKYDHARDELELRWLSKAREKNIPIFCICRGAQLLNIFHGGTLHTDITKVYENANYPNSLLAKIFFRKKINIRKNTRLDAVFQKKETEVNSLHSQSIDKLGKNLKLSAVEDNGVIQAIENNRDRFIMGVQFHPEFLFYRKDIRSLFRNFVEACRR